MNTTIRLRAGDSADVPFKVFKSNGRDPMDLTGKAVETTLAGTAVEITSALLGEGVLHIARDVYLAPGSFPYLVRVRWGDFQKTPIAGTLEVE